MVMIRDAYASYDQYEAVQRALRQLQISLDTLKMLIRLDTDLLRAYDVKEAIEFGAKASRLCAKRLTLAQELYESLKDNLCQQISWLGRRQFFELKCLCEFAENLGNRDNFLYESEAEEFIEALDLYDPSVLVNAEDILENYPLSVILPDVVDLMERKHQISRNYQEFVKNGHGTDEEPLREERMAEDAFPNYTDGDEAGRGED